MAEPGAFDEVTGAAVRAFQAARGLRVDGVCGHQTWSVLVEAGYSLGDRLLYLRQPMLRGDDVAELQRRLGALGFDAGRVDGIFGPRTTHALEQFQRNTGITVDAVCGPATLTMLERLGPSSSQRPPVALVRELELLRLTPRSLRGTRVAVGDAGGMHAAVHATARALGGDGAQAVVLDHPDQSEQAAEANAMGADVYVALRLDAASACCTSAYYAGHRYESPAGRRLAEVVQAVVPAALGVDGGGVRGMALPALRETRMPAVVCELGPPSVVVARTGALAEALRVVLSTWAIAPEESVSA